MVFDPITNSHKAWQIASPFFTVTQLQELCLQYPNAIVMCAETNLSPSAVISWNADPRYPAVLATQALLTGSQVAETIVSTLHKQHTALNGRDYHYYPYDTARIVMRPCSHQLHAVYDYKYIAETNVLELLTALCHKNNC